jgi:succinyl-CoA synthetase beta subunit
VLLLEHEGKAVLREFGIPIPKSVVVTSAAEAMSATAELQAPLMVKAQVLTGGRGKAGGIKQARSRDAVADVASEILSKAIKGHPVGAVLIEESVSIAHERYMAAMIDGESMLLLIGRQGGVEVESYFGDQKDTFETVFVDPSYGLSAYQVRLALEKLDISPKLWAAYTDIAHRTVRLLRDRDATLVEINPLAELSDGSLKALDALINVDTGAFFRQPQFAEIERSRVDSDDLVRRMKELEIQYVPLGGNIGLVSSGAGCGVTIIDWLAREGASAAAFIDLDYTIMSGKMEEGMRFVFDHFCDDPAIEAIIVNFTTCGLRLDDIATSLIKILRERSIRRSKPLFFNLQGNRATLAYDLMQSAGFAVAESLGDAVRGAVRQVKGAAV